MSDHCCHEEERNIFKNKTFLVAVFLCLVILLSYSFSFLEPFRNSLFMYFKSIWWAILLGLTIGGCIEYFIPKEIFSHTLARSNKRTIFYSVFLGFFMSICSHGILALAIQFHKKGASTPSVVSFLMASPWANLPLTLMLIGFFGFSKAMYIVTVAVVIAITTGFIFQWLENRGLVEKNPKTVIIDENFSITKSLNDRFKGHQFSRLQIVDDVKGVFKGMVSLSDMVLWWILIGTALAALAGAYIPSNIFHDYMGPNVFGMLVTLGVATVLEVCSEGTAPLAFEIFRQTGALGNAFVFLMAGVVTDYTEIGLLWHNIGRKTALWLPAIAVPQVIFFGILANKIF